MLASPHRLITWDYDGTRLAATGHSEGTVMVTSGGPEDRKADRFLRSFAEADFPDAWRRLVEKDPPQDDPGALVVRHEEHGQVFATVFGQLIEAAPGRLSLEHSRSPWAGGWRPLDVG
ncbi:hypothetical protein ACI792_04800 [Blastococcus sp. SYSU DS0669]